jgi:hypothetical protein
MDTQKLIDRVIRVARLDTAIYGEVEDDALATTQAGAVVLLAVLAAAIGGIQAEQPMATFVLGLIVTLLGWALWMGAIWGVANYILTESATHASYWGFARTVGFAAVPGVALIGAILPGMVGAVVFLAVNAWWVATTTLAVQQCLYYGDLIRSAIVVTVGWVVQVMVVQVFVFDALIGIAA